MWARVLFLHCAVPPLCRWDVPGKGHRSFSRCRALRFEESTGYMPSLSGNLGFLLFAWEPQRGACVLRGCVSVDLEL